MCLCLSLVWWSKAHEQRNATWLQACGRSCAACRCCEGAHRRFAGTRASLNMHNCLIWYQWSSRTTGCAMAHSKNLSCALETYWAKINARGNLHLDSIVQAIRLGFLRSLGSAITVRAWPRVLSETVPGTVQCVQAILPKWNIQILFQSAASRPQFFQLQAILAGHILIICRQTGCILSVSGKGTAATKWQMKFFKDKFVNTATTESKFSESL